MPAFTSEFLTFVAVLLGTVLYLAVLIGTFRRRSGQELSAVLLGVYVFIALVLQAGEAFWRGGFFPQMDERGFLSLEIFGTLFLAFLLALVVRAFLRREGWIWLALGVLWALGLVGLDANMLSLPDVLWTNDRVMLPRDGLTLAWAILGWVVFMGGVIGHLLSARRYLRQPLHRNRLSYWLPILLLIGVNDLFVLGGAGIIGNPLRLATFLLAPHSPVDRGQ